MAYIIGRGRYARESYPDRGGGSSQGIAGSYLVVLSALPETDPIPTLNALPNDNTTGLNQSNTGSPATDVLHVFVFPDACTLTRVDLKGDSASLGTVNQKTTDFPIDLYVNGVNVATLVTIPAGQTDINIPAAPGIAIPAGAEVQFVLPQPGNSDGNLENYLFAFAID